MAEDIKRSDLLLSLIKLEKDKGFVSLVDVIAAKKAYKEGKSYTNDEIIEALKEFDVHYTESEDGSDFDEEEPTEEELEGKVSLEDPLSLDDDEFDDFDDDEPTADDLNELEKDEAELIELRYMQNRSQTEVAQILGTNQVAVSRMERKILCKLRRKLS